MNAVTYFSSFDNINKKKYEALKDLLYHKVPAEQVALKFGYTISSVYSLARDFQNALKSFPLVDPFFKEVSVGRKPSPDSGQDNIIIDLRKKNFSIQDIEAVVNSKGFNVSYGYIFQLLKREGFSRLSRRSDFEKKSLEVPKLVAAVSGNISFDCEKFFSNATGIFAFLPYIDKYGIDKIIYDSAYPETKSISRISSILSFVALKLSNVKRYSNDDLWCMDRGLGLFGGLNVLPKSSWLSSYSSRVTKDMNIQFLKSLHKIYLKNNLLSDTTNLDFTTIPYWGNDDHLENNWSGKRNKALSSMLAVVAQDPDTGIIDYGHCDVQHENESNVVLEYLDFYKQDTKESTLQYLIFDSKFTNYENLSKLDDQNIKFITIRRRGKNILEQINNSGRFTTVRVEASGNKKRTLQVKEEIITLRGYAIQNTKKPKDIRQIVITGNGKIKPALIITNDFELTVEQIIRKYARRWLVEKGISEQVDFFHLNRLSSSMVIKVDFDFTMTILAHNLYRLFAMDLERYSNFASEKIFQKFISNSGQIEIKNDQIEVQLKKKRDLPQVLEMMNKFPDLKYSWLNNLPVKFIAASSS